jgi:alkaline phosphatase D
MAAVASDTARIVQLSDTHFSAVLGPPAVWSEVVDWLRRDPPDLVVHSGDIVHEDPDDAADHAFARALLAEVPAPLAVIPGNHDVGFYGEDAARPRRLAAFEAIWGADRFTLDLGGWRVVGVDAYRLGDEEHDAWFAAAVATAAPVLVFVHQPVRGDADDGWQMAGAARDAFDRAVAGADVRVVACGHRHRFHRDGAAVWAPSLTLTGPSEDPVQPGHPGAGLLEHVLTADGGHAVDVVRRWQLT